jgi:hypothetical protein
MACVLQNLDKLLAESFVVVDHEYLWHGSIIRIGTAPTSL